MPPHSALAFIILLFIFLAIIYFSPAIDCGPPPAGGNLMVEYSLTTYDSIAVYSCKNCYRLNSVNASITRQCRDTGHWSGPLPSCQSELLVSPLSRFHSSLVS